MLKDIVPKPQLAFGFSKNVFDLSNKLISR